MARTRRARRQERRASRDQGTSGSFRRCCDGVADFQPSLPADLPTRDCNSPCATMRVGSPARRVRPVVSRNYARKLRGTSLAMTARMNVVVPSLAALLLVSCTTEIGQDPNPEPPLSMSEAAMANNTETAFNFFVAKGLTKDQSAGIVGNLMQESSVNPNSVQYDGGPGRGIAQWSVGGRWDTSHDDNVTWYANDHGLNRWALTTQLDFIWYELTTDGYGFSTLKAATTVSAAKTRSRTSTRSAASAINRRACRTRTRCSPTTAAALPAARKTATPTRSARTWRRTRACRASTTSSGTSATTGRGSIAGAIRPRAAAFTRCDVRCRA